MSTHGLRLSSRGTLRIELRPLTEADEALYCSLYTDPDTMAFIGPVLSIEHAARDFHEVLRPADDGPGVFTVVEKAGGASVGLCGWHRPNARKREVEIGILLGTHGRNKRYSMEAIALVLDLAFASLPIDAVWVQYHLANLAADRLFVGMGMQSRGLEVDKGAQSTRVVRSIRRSMWQQLNHQQSKRK